MKWLFIAGAIVSAWVSGAGAADQRPSANNGAALLLLLAILFGMAAGVWR